MNAQQLSQDLSIAGQLTPADVPAVAEAGFRSILCNRPDAEGADQPSFGEIEQAAGAAGLVIRHVPVTSGAITEADIAAFQQAMDALPKPVLAYCRSGARSTTMWSLTEAKRGRPVPEILASAKGAGHDMNGATRRIAARGGAPAARTERRFTVVVVGGGSAGIAVAASLKARKPDLAVAVIDPADVHYYQPGWTMVGAGVFDQAETAKTLSSQIPDGVTWIKAGVVAFEPDNKVVVLEGGQIVGYDRLVVAPGLVLDWAGIEGLSETLGRNGVTSNYRFDLAPYTWELVQALGAGRAVFTQPPMPIKCAGAPQKAMYLSADHWRREGRLKDIAIDFFTATPGLFGVKDFVPSLMAYVRRYEAQLHFKHNLTRIDGPAQRAWFTRTAEDGSTSTVETAFDMIHVVPPQRAPDFVRVSPLADAAGWIEVDQATLRHKRLPDVYALGDACNAPNAKTAAAARKQAPVVAHNLLRDMGLVKGADALYDGYGSCPLTVERGKILLAEFGYGGALLPSFPSWFIDGTKPSQAAWLLKERMLPPLYWQAMLKGREWMAKPRQAGRAA